jgi:hypothetical protein
MSYPGSRSRTLSLAGLGMSVIITGACLASLRWQFGFAGERMAVTLVHGGIRAGVMSTAPPRGTGFWASPVGGGFLAWPQTFSSSSITVIALPLWMPFLAFAVPSIIGWWRTRRRPSSQCPSCGYDLTGNVSGLCPECGTEVPPP